jgi:hypothetical protein
VFKRLCVSRRATLVAVSCLVVILSLLAFGVAKYAFAANTPVLALATTTADPAPVATNGAAAGSPTTSMGGAAAPSTTNGGAATAPSTAPSAVGSPATPAGLQASTAVTSPKATVPTSTTSKTATTQKPQPARFQWSVATIDDALKQAMTESGVWRSGAPVSLGDLRVLRVSFWDFNGKVQSGQLVVNQAWAKQLAGVFRTLFDARFPIRGMDPTRPAGVTGTLDQADNTRSFQARRVNGGWSMHAYGQAVDINPAENPWMHGGSVTPGVGAAFKDRSLDAPGLVKPNSIVVRAFKAIGWTWGGTWSSSKDYMHFSSNGH